ncbi:MAG TPA: amidase [Vicinamibacterales bacterium]|nr:amidase [Vicinamibacterales bacterium]
MSIVSAAERLRRGDIRSIDLVESALSAIGAHNPSTNAFISVRAEEARLDAKTADRERASGVDRGPLHGIPISLKDLIDEAGRVTTAASKVLADRVPAVDAPVVARLRHAGAVVIGRTNLHEFALGTTSEDSAFGPVRNPADLTRSAGGSSGGSAVAVACGMGLASIGTDTGGSIRIPAAACGIVGLKPGYNEVPTAGVIPLSPSLDHVGPLATSVPDAAIVWATLAGRAPEPLGVMEPARIRLARLTGYFDAPVESAVRDACAAAIDRLAAAGVVITQVEILDGGAIPPAYVYLVLKEANTWHSTYLATRGALYTPTVGARLASGRDVTEAQYQAALEVAAAVRRSVDALLEPVDALVLPTLPILAPPLGSGDIVIDGHPPMPVRAAMLKHTQPFNFSGHPAISLPVPADGLPVGLQLVGRRDGTARLLAIAAACEKILSRA